MSNKLKWENNKGKLNPVNRYKDILNVYGKPDILVNKLPSPLNDPVNIPFCNWLTNVDVKLPLKADPVVALSMAVAASGVGMLAKT